MLLSDGARLRSTHRTLADTPANLKEAEKIKQEQAIKAESIVAKDKKPQE